MQDQQPTTIAPTAVQPAATVSVPPPPTLPAEPRPTVRSQGSARLLNLALAGAVVLAIAGVAFAVGRFTAPAAVSAGNFPNEAGGGQFFRNGQGGQGGQGGQNGATDGRGVFFGGGVTIEGTVQSVSGSTLTLTTASGQTIQIALNGGTTYHAQTDATASDVTTGGKVLVRLNLRGAGGGANGPTASGAPTSPTASDVTVVP